MHWLASRAPWASKKNCIEKIGSYGILEPKVLKKGTEDNEGVNVSRNFGEEPTSKNLELVAIPASGV